MKPKFDRFKKKPVDELEICRKKIESAKTPEEALDLLVNQDLICAIVAVREHFTATHTANEIYKIHAKWMGS